MQGIGIVLFTLGGKNLKRALRGLTDVLDKTVVVNDGKDIKLGVSEEKKIKKFINTVYEKYPSACYNIGVRELLKDDSVEHIFIINDSIEILDDTLFQDYIDVHKKTKLKALYYCTDDDDPMGKFNNVRLTVDLGDNELTLNMGTSGSLVYLHKDVFRKCGFFDERYRAAVEWSDFSYRLSQQNLSTPFLWFPHVKSVSDKLIVSDNNVMYEESMEDRIIRGMKLFYMKYKCQIQDLIDTYSKKDVISKLKNKSRTS
tara:strand:+ start:8360 stop:9130 length:771 start_codon:yes stop_codon:yes gene_type:complete